MWELGHAGIGHEGHTGTGHKLGIDILQFGQCDGGVSLISMSWAERRAWEAIGVERPL